MIGFMSDTAPIHLAFEEGTLVVTGGSDELLAALPYCKHDSRTGVYRAEGHAYRPLVEYLRSRQIAYKDTARLYQLTPWPLRTSRDPFPHQSEAVAAWWRGGENGRGVVVLPTGTGKTFVAILAIHEVGRPALVITPTIDLMTQWYSELRLAFDVPVGLLGGGYHDIQPLTVTTYDSAHAYVERWGNRFGLLIFDECHHLPGASYMNAAIASLAPYRMGLSVGAGSICELRGGCFGAGWVGSIADAYERVEASAAAARTLGNYEILPATGIEARGFTGERFAWKAVRSFIRHPSPERMCRVKAAGDWLELTWDHALYRVEGCGFQWVQKHKKYLASLQVRRADECQVGDILPMDDGEGWEGSEEPLYDTVALARRHQVAAQVAVSLAGITREMVGASPQAWYEFANTGPHGPRLPIERFALVRDQISQPTWVYTEAAKGTRVAPTIRLSDWAYVLGFFLGDGWLSGGQVCFAVVDDRAEELRRRLQTLPGVEWHVSTWKAHGRSVELRCSSRLIACLFRDLFAGARCYEKAIPGEWIVSWPTAARRALLGGLLDSDGYAAVKDGNRFSHVYVTTSRKMAASLLSLLRSMGINGSICERPLGKGGVIEGRQIQARHASYSVIWSGWAAEGENKGRKGNRRSFLPGELRFLEAPVRAIEEIEGRGFVYDLEMEGHPSFVANGLLVHNTATLERTDGQEVVIESLIGPVVYRREIKELAGDFLAEYRTERLYVELTEEEAAAYQQARDFYRQFCAERGISMSGPNGWRRFIQETCRSSQGREAFNAFREQRRLALAAPAKLKLLEQLLEQHRRDRVLIFTYDNATVYQIARQYLVPAITHQTKVKERRHILDGFQTGEYSIVVTSRVLNEGVDVPAANVGIVLSGTSTVREHVQRLGRLLRKHGEKQALLIEVVTRGTVEEYITERRRQHHAYQ
jgi:superfamily II DNA or RNA helicase